jgi:hypothetical protein
MGFWRLLNMLLISYSEKMNSSCNLFRQDVATSAALFLCWTSFLLEAES